jgi:hypothetical protein
LLYLNHANSIAQVAPIFKVKCGNFFGGFLCPLVSY